MELMSKEDRIILYECVDIDKVYLRKVDIHIDIYGYR